MLPNTTKLKIEKQPELTAKIQVSQSNTVLYIVLAVVVLGAAFFLIKK